MKEDGTVWVFGYNLFGQLGDGTTEQKSTPVQAAGLKDVKAIAAGGSHTVALKEDGTVWMFGFIPTLHPSPQKALISVTRKN